MIRRLWKRNDNHEPRGLARRPGSAANPAADATPAVEPERMITLDCLGQTMVATVVESDLNGDKVGELAFQLADAMTTRAGTRNLVIDLQNVEYLDSACLNQLVDLFSRIKEAGGRVAIARTTAQIHDLFKLTRLDRLFPVHRTVIDAIGAVERAG